MLSAYIEIIYPGPQIVAPGTHCWCKSEITKDLRRILVVPLHAWQHWTCFRGYVHREQQHTMYSWVMQLPSASPAQLIKRP